MEDLYNLRKSYPKSHPLNLVCKLLLNSLYGRFGLNPLLDTFLIVSKNKLEKELKSKLPFLQERIDFGDMSMYSLNSDEPKPYGLARTLLLLHLLLLMLELV